MVFRKPYGFLIKHFRLIHLIVTAILVYLVTYSRELYNYLNSCINDSVNRYNSLNYINFNIFIWIVLVIGLLFIIYWLLRYKDKPKNLYIFSIIGYFCIGIFIFFLFGYFEQLHTNVVNQKVIRAYRDISLITLLYQYIIIIIMFIRGLGFDIKKFNFNRDIHELGLNPIDEEEIDVNVNIDSDVLFRGVRKKKREFGYFYQEHKVIILIILLIIFIVLGYNGYKYFSNKYKVYNQGDSLGNEYIVSILDSYYEISNKNYIIVKFNIYKYGKQDRFDVNKLILLVGKSKYIPNKNICYNYDNIGICYKKQYVTNDVKEYILVYEVDGINSEKSYLLYQDSYENNFKIKLNLENYG